MNRFSRTNFNKSASAIGGFSLLLLMASCSKAPEESKPSKSTPAAKSAAEKPADLNQAKTVHLGYFPNVTHAQALIGVSRGDFQTALGSEVKLETSTYNAGPSVIEALFAGHLDIAYVGPSPTLNGFIQSKGKEVRVIAGAATNGVLIVGNKKRNYTSLDQLAGKRIASPQLGNTQDISAKYFVVHTLNRKLKELGGDTEVVPIQNPDIEILFEKDQLDAAWVPEPWGSRLIDKGLANLLGEEKDLWPNKQFTLTLVIARAEFLEKNPELVKKFLASHKQITQELVTNAQGFASIIGSELKRLTGKELPEPVLLGSLQHVGFSTDPGAESIQQFFEKGRELKLIKAESLNIDELIKVDLLKELPPSDKLLELGTYDPTNGTDLRGWRPPRQ